MSAQSPERAQVRAVEQTLLKATAGNRENLKTYIALNWFAMDKIARERGLIKDFTMLDTGSDDGAWNVLVSVTYHDARGYEGVAAEFEKIRAAHKIVVVNGKRMPELGTIVESRKLYENPSHSSQ